MRAVVGLLLLALSQSGAAQQAFDVTGFVSLRGIQASGPDPWIEGGWGRLESGDDRAVVKGEVHAGMDWRPSRFFSVHVGGVGRVEPDRTRGDAGGIVEAFVDATLPLGLDEVRLRAGQFFLPTSRENIDELWASPYTIAFSALNTWIGEEVRPIGIDLQYRHVTGAGHTVTAGATAFQGTDTAGTLLAWRGWSMGSRLSTYGEVLPIAGFAVLHPFFPVQRDGTTAIGSDLDGRTGYAARLRYAIPERMTLQYARVDNAGDRGLYGDEYSWDTITDQVALQFGNPDGVVIAAEYLSGRTLMGRRAFNVQAGISAGYLLLSAKHGRHRWSGRYDVFSTDERDFSGAESNSEDGQAWTLSWFYDLTSALRLGIEGTSLTASRPGTPDPDARSLTLETRYRF